MELFSYYTFKNKGLTSLAIIFRSYGTYFTMSILDLIVNKTAIGSKSYSQGRKSLVKKKRRNKKFHRNGIQYSN